MTGHKINQRKREQGDTGVRGIVLNSEASTLAVSVGPMHVVFVELTLVYRNL